MARTTWQSAQPMGVADGGMVARRTWIKPIPESSFDRMGLVSLLETRQRFPSVS